MEPTTPLTDLDLEAFLLAHNITGEVLRLPVPTLTVAAAAEALGVSPEQILKTVVFIAQEHPVLVIARGTGRIDTRALARHLGLSRKRVRVARPAEVLAATGYAVGTVPPLGHRQPLLTLIDQRVFEVSMAYAGGGAPNAMLRIAPRVLLAATGAEVVALQEGGNHAT